MDYGKYKYMQAKKDREARKSQKVSLLREVRLRPKIGEHDFNAKARSARKLLDGGDKVKLTILFRGREITHPEIGWRLLQKMAAGLKDIAVIDRQPAMDNRRMILILAPLTAVKGKPKAEVKAEAKPEKKAAAKPEKKAEAKPEKKAEAEPEKKAAAKPEVKAEAEPAAEPEKKVAGKPEAGAAEEAAPAAETETEKEVKDA